MAIGDPCMHGNWPGACLLCLASYGPALAFTAAPAFAPTREEIAAAERRGYERGLIEGAEEKRVFEFGRACERARIVAYLRDNDCRDPLALAHDIENAAHLRETGGSDE